MDILMNVGVIVLAAGVMLLLFGAVIRYRKEDTAWRLPAIIAIAAVTANIILDMTIDMDAPLRWLIAGAVGGIAGGINLWVTQRKTPKNTHE